MLFLLDIENTPLFFSAQALIDFGNLFTPPLPFSMFHVHNFFKRPVEMICNESYLLVDSVEGVAYYSP